MFTWCVCALPLGSVAARTNLKGKEKQSSRDLILGVPMGRLPFLFLSWGV